MGGGDRFFAPRDFCSTVREFSEREEVPEAKPLPRNTKPPGERGVWLSGTDKIWNLHFGSCRLPPCKSSPFRSIRATGALCLSPSPQVARQSRHRRAMI